MCIKKRGSTHAGVSGTGLCQRAGGRGGEPDPPYFAVGYFIEQLSNEIEV